MADQQKNGDVERVDRTANTGAAKRTTQASGEGIGDQRASEPNRTAEPNRAVPGTIAARKRQYKRQYLIATRPLPGFAESSMNSIHETLKQIEDIEILRRLRSKGFPRGFGAFGPAYNPEIIVVRMDDQRAHALRQSAPVHVVIEQDGRLEVGQSALPSPFATLGGSVPAPRRRHDVRFRVVGSGDQPLAGAGITVYGRNFAAQAITDAQGAASVAVFDANPDLEDIRAVHVLPASDHWEVFVRQPALAAGDVNVVKLLALFQVGTKAAGEKRISWGQKLMNLDLPADASAGAGIKVGLIDSGCDNSHPELHDVARGTDLSRRDGTRDWTRDEIGQGTHCAGIVASIAPAAEIHVFKVSPGGHFSDLIEALDQCIEQKIDIVHLGCVADQMSELISRKIAEARLAGVACIAASGDRGGPVQFPAVLPSVLAVSAIGRFGEFPPDTHHVWTAVPESIGSAAGLFPTNFSGSGSQIAVCAPGVAVISSVPGGGYAARDGTAPAAAHVVGLGAVIMSQHPLFRGMYRSPGEERVRALFELIINSAVSPVFDPLRVGAGLPDLTRVSGFSCVDTRSRRTESVGGIAGSKNGFAEHVGVNIGSPSAFASTVALMQMRAAGLI